MLLVFGIGRMRKTKMKEPEFRCSTKKAIEELAIELNLKERIPHWDSMAGYSYTPGNPEDIQQYLDYYEQLSDDDKKFTLMEMILDSLAEQPDEIQFLRFWKNVEPILTKDYSIHQYTVHYWKDMTNEFSRSNILTPRVQSLMTNMTPKD